MTEEVTTEEVVSEEVVAEEAVIDVGAPAEELVVTVVGKDSGVEYITLDDFIVRENLPSFYHAALLHKLGHFARPLPEWYDALKV